MSKTVKKKPVVLVILTIFQEISLFCYNRFLKFVSQTFLNIFNCFFQLIFSTLRKKDVH